MEKYMSKENDPRTDPRPGQACKLSYEHDVLSWECYSRDRSGKIEWVGILTKDSKGRVSMGQVPLEGWQKRFKDGVVVDDNIISEDASPKMKKKIEEQTRYEVD